MSKPNQPKFNGVITVRKSKRITYKIAGKINGMCMKLFGFSHSPRYKEVISLINQKYSKEFTCEKSKGIDVYNFLVEQPEFSGSKYKPLIPDAPIPKRTKPPKVKSPSLSKQTSKDFLNSYEWTELRYKILLKYGPVCMCCGATKAEGRTMNVDHIKPRKTHPELALDENNLQVLCSTCNKGKCNWDSTDWRPD